MEAETNNEPNPSNGNDPGLSTDSQMECETTVKSEVKVEIKTEPASPEIHCCKEEIDMIIKEEPMDEQPIGKEPGFIKEEPMYEQSSGQEPGGEDVPCATLETSSVATDNIREGVLPECECRDDNTTGQTSNPEIEPDTEYGNEKEPKKLNESDASAKVASPPSSAVDELLSDAETTVLGGNVGVVEAMTDLEHAPPDQENVTSHLAAETEPGNGKHENSMVDSEVTENDVSPTEGKTEREKAMDVDSDDPILQSGNEIHTKNSILADDSVTVDGDVCSVVSETADESVTKNMVLADQFVEDDGDKALVVAEHSDKCSSLHAEHAHDTASYPTPAIEKVVLADNSVDGNGDKASVVAEHSDKCSSLYAEHAPGTTSDPTAAIKNVLADQSLEGDGNKSLFAAEHSDECSPIHSEDAPGPSPAPAQSLTDSIDGKDIDGSASRKTADEATKENVDTSKLSLNQLKKYYKWCNLGLSASEALSKAKEPGLVPHNENPHPDCKLLFEEIKQISLLIQAKHPRNKFIIETLFGGKDPEEQLKLALSSSTVERHPACKQTWEELKKMCAQLSKESLKMKFMVETFYEGKDPGDVLESVTKNIVLPDKSVDGDGNKASGLAERSDESCSVRSENATGSSSPAPAQSLTDSIGSKDIDGSASSKTAAETTKETLDTSKLSLNQLKKYYKWCNLGLSASEALSKAKEPGLVPHNENPHPNCKLPFEEIKQISSLIHGKHAKSRFIVETVYGGKDPEEEFKLALSTTGRHPECKQTWEDLKKMSAQLSKEWLKMKFLFETFYEGRNPGEVLETLLLSTPSTSDQSTLVKDSSAADISMLELNKLRKYYKWRILGLPHEEAIVKAKERGLNPETKGSHPNCKLPWKKIKQISLLLPPKGGARFLFETETFFGGKDLEEQLKISFVKANAKPHPACKRTWEQLVHLSKQIPDESMRWVFVIESYYGGKPHEELLKSMLSQKAEPAGDVPDVDGPVSKTVSFSDDAKAGPSDDSDHPSGIESGPLGELSNSKLQLYYLWLESGFPHKQALRKACNLDAFPLDHSVHPKCKLSKADLTKMSLALPDPILRDRFVIHTYFGGKDPQSTLKQLEPDAQETPKDVKPKTPDVFDDTLRAIEGLKLENEELKTYFLWRNEGFPHPDALAKAKNKFLHGSSDKPHPNCQQTLKQLRFRTRQWKVGRKIRERFVVYVYFGGMNPNRTEALLLGNVDDKLETTDEPESSDDSVSSLEKLNLSNGHLKYYFLWRNKGLTREQALSNVRSHVPVPGTHNPHPNCIYSRETIRFVAKELEAERFYLERLEVYVYFGGKQIASTLKHFTSRLAGAPEDVPEPPQLGGYSDYDILSIEELNLSNILLKQYLVSRNMGFPHETALHNVQRGVNIPGPFKRHPKCTHSSHDLRSMSTALRENKRQWDRYLLYTFIGGMDPQVTLHHFLSRSGKRDQPSAGEPSSVQAKDSPQDIDLKLIDESPLDNRQLRFYYLWRRKGYDHKMALSCSTEEAKLKGILGDPLPHPNCKLTEKELRTFSRALSSNAAHFDRFFIHTYYGGQDPKATLDYFMSQGNVQNVPGKSPAKAERAPLPFEPVGKRTRSNPYAGIIPFDSPHHPSKELDVVQLKNYYLWVSQGIPREEAIVKAKTRGLIPTRQGSKCLVPLHVLKGMSQKLPPGYLREMFIIETYYAGYDPEYVMEYMLSKVGNDSDADQSIAADPQDAPSAEEAPDVSEAESANNSDSTVFDKETNQLENGELKYYYLFRNRGLSIEESLQNAKNHVGFQGVHARHPRCKFEQVEVRRMAKKLPTNKRDRFLVHVYFGGKDPIRTKQLLNGQLSVNDACNPTQSQLQQHQQPNAFPPQQEFGNRQDPNAFRTQPQLQQQPNALPTQSQLQHPQDFNAFPRQPQLQHQPNVFPTQPQLQHQHQPNVYPPQSQLQHQQQPIAFPAQPQHQQQPIGFPAQPQHQQQPSNCGPFAFVPATHQPLPGQPVADAFTGQLSYPAPGVCLPPPVVPYQYDVAGPSSMAFFPPAAPAPSVVQPFDQLPPGPPTVAYSPSQFVAAPVTYPPPAVPPPTDARVGQLPPTSVAPPIQQPPLPLNDTASTTKTATPQVTKVVEPLVGVHDPKLSSLKRKATDELPIKINLKTSSDEPKPPKKLPRQTQRIQKTDPKPPQQDTKETQEKTCAQDIPHESDGSLPVFILPTGYPKVSLTESQMDAIESALLEAILEMDDDGTKPSFKDANRTNGRYNITCVDQFSANWLHKFLDKYKPWPGADLKMVSSQIRANAILPSCKNDDTEKILKFIDRQNKGLNVGMWIVVQRWDNGDFNTCMDLVIDEESAEILRKSSKINFKLGSAEIVTSNKGMPPTSRHEHPKPSKEESDSSKASPSSSYPPPPKCMRTGEGFPALPKKVKEAASVRGSSGDSKRSRDESPRRSSKSKSPSGDKFAMKEVDPVQGSSGLSKRPKRTRNEFTRRSTACRSPSVDRFGRPISRSEPSDDDDLDDGKRDQSMLDWFYSKEDPPASSRSRSPPSRYSRERRRYYSRSPSPENRRYTHKSQDRHWDESPYPTKRRREASRSPSSSSDEHLSSRYGSTKSRHYPSRY